MEVPQDHESKMIERHFRLSEIKIWWSIKKKMKPLLHFLQRLHHCDIENFNEVFYFVVLHTLQTVVLPASLASCSVPLIIVLERFK